MGKCKIPSVSCVYIYMWISREMKWRVRPTRCNKLWFINNPLAEHVSGIIMSIFRSAGCMLLHMVFSTGCAENICSNIQPALLKMDIMMPETCWANGLLISHNLLHLFDLTRHFILRMHGHTNIRFPREMSKNIGTKDTTLYTGS